MKLLACSILEKEINQVLKNLGREDIDIKYLNSMLHMFPEKLHTTLEKEISEVKSNDVGLIYGECHNFMDSNSCNKKIQRVNGRNCIEIMLGRDLYRKLSKEGAFFLMPEWTVRWHEIFSKELDLDDKTAKEFMQDMHNYLLFLDTGYRDIPYNDLKDLSEYTGLKYSILKIDLKNLTEEIRTIIDGS